MKKNFLTKIKSFTILATIGIAGLVFTGCTEDIDQSNRYTFTGETITDYLENRPELYSSFCFILDKAKIGKSTSGSILKALSTYGSYTCFAPTNVAVDSFIIEQYTLYKDSKDAFERGEILEKDIVITGIESPYLEDLTDSMATVIAKNHIIEAAYLTSDISEGVFPKNNINNRFTSVSFDNDEEGNVIILINNSAKILESDVEAVNGIIHTVDKVVSPSNKLVSDHLAQYEEFGIHSEALVATGIDEILRKYELDLYPDDPEVRYDKYLTSPEKMSTGSNKAPYPETYVQKYTLLAVTNATYAENNISSLEDLVDFAEKWYSTSEDPKDYKNPENALYKLMAYHIIDRQLHYNGSAPGGFVMDGFKETHQGFDANKNIPNTFDRYDYFETLLPYSIIKATRPKISAPMKDALILNYSQEDGTRVSNPEMRNHINAIIRPTLETANLIEDFSDNTLNGSIYSIDRILIYNEEEMKGNVLNERMRWDSSSIFPELTNNGVRWHERAPGWTEIYIPDGYCSRLKINNNTTSPFYLTPHPNQLNGWANYQGDEILVDGQYDFEYRLPYVPEGTYEIRFGFGFSSARGICQFYLDGKITGIPINMLRNDADNSTMIGKMNDYTDSKLEAAGIDIDDFDKSLRNRGWMKGPASVFSDADDAPKSMRESTVAYRRIVTQANLTKGDHWLRFKDVTKGGGNLRQFSQDYLEIVPKGIITDPSKPEDKN